MNVLPIVFSILMLLAIITYSQLQNFLVRGTIRREYVCYMQNRSRDSLNLLQEELYDKNEVPGESRDNWIKINALSKVNLNVFLQDPTTNEKSALLNAHNGIIRRLIENIYADRPFFQEFEEKRPDAVNELWQAVVRALKRLDEQGKGIGKAKHLANIQLDDPELNLFFAQMLKQIQTPESILYDCESKKVKDVQKKVEYYPNLIDFVGVDGKTEKPYRVWLASKPLLQAIFQDESVVEAIMVERSELHKQLNNVPKDRRDQVRSELNDTFEQQFRNKLPSDMPAGIVTFETSLSRPKK
ncbi:MAG: hypothetical protein K940chlam3_00509 [Chlamydiae bacterium]|nr:hypothetical protein [Chlamydiota bacterium]